ncbi:MAG: prepilin peptidase [Clostridia bacterium]|nr:prepilin peptidase [Clostridia bacterium]
MRINLVESLIQNDIWDGISTSWEIALFTVILLVIVLSSLGIASILRKVMQKKGFLINSNLIIIPTVIISVLLTLRYGISVQTIQGIFLFFVLLYASLSDLTYRVVDDSIWVIILALSLVSISEIGFISMFIGGLAVFVIQLGVATLFEDKAYGGADLKISTALTILLGCTRGLFALVIGIGFAVIFTLIYNKIKNRSNRIAFPLVPFLSVGAMLMFFI